MGGVLRHWKSLHRFYYRKDEGNSSAKFVDVPINSLNVQLPVNTGNTGKAGNISNSRRKRATDLAWSLTELEEYKIYIIRVLLYTVGNSEYSPPVEIQTAEDGRNGGSREEGGEGREGEGSRGEEEAWGWGKCVGNGKLGGIRKCGRWGKCRTGWSVGEVEVSERGKWENCELGRWGNGWMGEWG